MVFELMWLTSAFEPRGMTRSITSSSASSSVMVSRLVTSPMTAGSTSGASADITARCMALLDRMASLPPLSSRPLPERSASAAICGSASGRLSKMIMSTPSELVRCSSTSPSASSVRASRRSSGSSESAMERMPDASCCSLPGFIWRRLSRWSSTPFWMASCRSRAFSSRISVSRASSASATRRSSAARRSLLSACRAREAARAASAMTRASPPPPFSVIPASDFIDVTRTKSALAARVSKSVPIGSPLSTTRLSVSCFLPLAITTGVPERAAAHAASTLAAMPPRPTRLLPLNSMAASCRLGEYVRSSSDDGSDGSPV
mmetsp:Transcript_20977/g.64988  ORF Transcript_20977/g.64988 Transcript_20977/m.64988 type:complete len:319 (-) Transcript_20977:703-1659(-)